MQHESQKASDAGERAGTSEAERRERLTRLPVDRRRESREVIDLDARKLQRIEGLYRV